MNIPIIFDDEWFLVVDKPAGLLVIPSPKKESRTLTSILNDEAKVKGWSFRFHPCHRLDRETSGVTLFAKGKAAQKKMMDEFQNKKVTKDYFALVHGKVDSSGEIRFPIEGKTALTRFKLLKSFPLFSAVEVFPATGRTNQIRLHFKEMGHPLVGETKFAFRKDFSLKAKRLCLHAWGIKFEHPFTGSQIAIEAPIAADIEDFVAKHN